MLCGSLWVSALGWAQRPATPDDCDDSFAECKEDCTITYGGTTNDKARAKVNKCLTKCNTVELECRERFFETKRNALDEGSLNNSPGSRQVDENGMPDPAASKKRDRNEGRTKVSESPAPREEDLRDDRQRDAPPAKVEKKKNDAPAREEETPKSSRTQISTADTKPEPTRSEVREDPPPPKDEPKKGSSRAGAAAKRAEPREDPPPKRVEPREDPPPKRVEPREDPPPKRAEPREDPPPKRDEPKKKKALDEWDPDAL